MISGRAIVIAAILLTGLIGFGAESQSDRNCAICSKRFGSDEKVGVWKVVVAPLRDAVKAGAFAASQVCQNEDGHDKRAPAGETVLWICSDCSLFSKRCSICQLPIKGSGVLKANNHWVCPLHANAIVPGNEMGADAVILDQEMAAEVFEQVRKEAVEVAGDFFALKIPLVTVRLTNFPPESGLLELFSGQQTIALSTTWKVGQSIVSHDVALRRNMLKGEAFYALVHEYTHLWINENIGRHYIEKHTKEAICELVAYKVAQKLGDEVGQRRIRANPYTAGRIHDLIDYALKEPLYATLVWVSQGQAETLDAGVATTTLPLDVQVALAQQARSRSPQDEHQTPSLNGIIHTAKGTLILLSGGLVLGKGESGLAKRNGEPARIRCVDIMNDSAVVQWENATNAVTLQLLKQ